MRTVFDFSPYRRSTVGFDRLFDTLEAAALDAHVRGLTWRRFQAAHAAEIDAIIRTNPAGWPAIGHRLARLLDPRPPLGSSGPCASPLSRPNSRKY